VTDGFADRSGPETPDAPGGERDANEPEEPAGGAPTEASAGTYDRQTTVIARTVARVAVPIILVTAVALLLQGHNFPGGGFIGGVLTVTAFVLVYTIFGLDYLQDELLGVPVDPDTEEHGLVGSYRWLFSVGLALAVLAGLVPIVFDLPFLTQGVLFLEHLPLYGEFEVASALAFDFGVYFVVVGALLAIIGEVGAE
jgi:multicomponent Na+:H+ antiporter subunit B